MLLYDDDNYSSSSDSEQQFIEDSQYNSSDDEEEEDGNDHVVDDNQDEGLSLRRTLSLGKSGSTTSLRNMAQPPCSAVSSSQSKNPRNFIEGTTDVNKDSQQAVRPYPLKRNSSSGNFIFNSESEEESSSDEEQGLVPITNQLDKGVTTKSDAVFNPANIRAQKETPPPKPPNASDSSQSFRIVNNTPSPAEVGSSDVAIEGYFSPRNESIKSVVSEGRIIDHQDHSEMDNLTKGFENCHIDDVDKTKNKKVDNVQITGKETSMTDASNESLQKVMQNAKGMASKYLHPWKRADERQRESSSSSS